MKSTIKKMILIALLSLLPVQLAFAQVAAGDSLALVKLYDALDGPNWNNNTNWKSTAPVREWYGVFVALDRVQEIKLPNNNLKGQIPVEIGDLLGLRILNLSSNALEGSIPLTIKDCAQLETLTLAWNNFSDTSFPAEMGQLSALTTLNLASCNLSSAPSWIFDLPNLQTLYISYNNINTIPVALENLAQLNSLDISYNPMDGVLPSQLFKLSNLKTLNIASTGMTDVPTFITDMSWLQNIYLYSNNLDEGDTKNFTNFTNLTTLNLNGNQFTQVPAEISGLPNLENLYLSSNQITDTGVDALANLTDLKELALSYNQLTMVPTVLFAMNGLITLDLNHNAITGTIPIQLGGFPNLQSLFLNGNQFEGPVPDEIAALNNLRNLLVQENNLDELPAFKSTNNFYLMGLQENYFTFEDIIPNVGLASDETYAPQKEIGQGMDTLATLGSVVEIRQLIGGTGNQYQWFKDGSEVAGAQSATLQVQLNSPTDFGTYQLKATNSLAPELEIWSAPFTITQQNQLEQDSLALVDMYNALNGDSWLNKSGWLTSKVSNWFGVVVQDNRVTEIHLQGNNLVGELPASIGNLTALRVLELDGNGLYLAVPSEITALTSLEEIQLQGNELESIPDFNQLPALKILNLERNLLVFEDLIPVKNAASVTFSCAPQDSLVISTPSALAIGSSVALDAPTHHTNNAYSWFLNTVNLALSTNPYTISSFSYSDEGFYSCEITNSQLPQLTLHTKRVHLQIMDAPTISSFPSSVTTLPRTAYIPFTVRANGLETSVSVYYGLNTNYGSVAGWQGTPFLGSQEQGGQIVLEDLIPNQNYHFHVVASNNIGEATTTDFTFLTPDYPGSIQVSQHIDLPAYGKPGEYTTYDYRIVGVPGGDIFSVSEIFSGDPWDDWLAYRDNGGPDYYYEEWDGTDKFNFETGRAFWVVSLHGADINRSVSSASLNALSEVEINLQSGWNLITNPFTQNVAWADVAVLNGFDGISLFSYESEWRSVDQMEPYKGYLFQKPAMVDNLRIPYPGTPIAKKGALAKTNSGWQVGIALQSGEHRDATVRFGAREPSEGFFNQTLKPRAPGHGISIWIESENDETQLVSDFRTPGADGQTWRLGASMNVGQRNVVSFNSLDEIPQDTKLYMLHLESGRKVCLNDEPQMVLWPKQEENYFVVLSGSDTYVAEEISRLLPQDFELQQNYPNPFNPQTQISYQLAKETGVILQIYNARGQLVRTLAQGKQTAGFYQVNFDGSRLASGIYYYRLQTPEFSKTRKMLLVR